MVASRVADRQVPHGHGLGPRVAPELRKPAFEVLLRIRGAIFALFLYGLLRPESYCSGHTASIGSVEALDVVAGSQGTGNFEFRSLELNDFLCPPNTDQSSNCCLDLNPPAITGEIDIWGQRSGSINRDAGNTARPVT